MSLSDLALVTSAMLALTVLRFGVPIALMWSFGAIRRRLSHTV